MKKTSLRKCKPFIDVLLLLIYPSMKYGSSIPSSCLLHFEDISNFQVQSCTHYYLILYNENLEYINIELSILPWFAHKTLYFELLASLLFCNSNDAGELGVIVLIEDSLKSRTSSI